MTRSPTSKELPALPGRLVSAITIASGAIFPPVPSLFGRPQMLDSAATAGRALLRLGIDTPGSGRWEGM